MGDITKYTIIADSVYNCIMGMYNAFISMYVKKGNRVYFPAPNVDLRYYTKGYLDGRDPDENIIQGCYSYEEVKCLWHQHNLAFNIFKYDGDRPEMSVYVLLHEFAHYLHSLYESILLKECRKRGVEPIYSEIGEDIMTSSRAVYRKLYFRWDTTLCYEHGLFLRELYLAYNEHIRASIFDFADSCVGFNHLSFEYYKACYIAWRLYFINRHHLRNPPIFSFKDILQYDTPDLTLKLINEVLY